MSIPKLKKKNRSNLPVNRKNIFFLCVSKGIRTFKSQTLFVDIVDRDGFKLRDAIDISILVQAVNTEDVNGVSHLHLFCKGHSLNEEEGKKT